MGFIQSLRKYFGAPENWGPCTAARAARCARACCGPRLVDVLTACQSVGERGGGARKKAGPAIVSDVGASSSKFRNAARRRSVGPFWAARH
jgi:hypothetical protein